MDRATSNRFLDAPPAASPEARAWRLGAGGPRHAFPLGARVAALALLMIALLAIGRQARAVDESVETLTRILGAEPIRVEGEGLITGLNGTGDKSTAAKNLVLKYLATNKISLNADDLAASNVALVKIDAIIPPFSYPGSLIDVRVSSISDAQSLKGGVLQMSVLKARTDGDILARASGRIMLSSAENPVTGRIPDGGFVMRHEDTAQPVVNPDTGQFTLVLKRHSFSDASAIAEALNESDETNPYRQERFLGEEPGQVRQVAQALNAGAVLVTIPPKERRAHVRYINEVLNTPVIVSSVARVVLDRENGTAVITGKVKVHPGFISYKGRTVTIAPTPDGQTRYTLANDTPRPVVDLRGPGESGGRSLQSLIDTLAAMQTTTDEIIVILQRLKAAGLMKAELIIE